MQHLPPRVDQGRQRACHGDQGACHVEEGPRCQAEDTGAMAVVGADSHSHQTRHGRIAEDPARQGLPDKEDNEEDENGRQRQVQAGVEDIHEVIDVIPVPHREFHRFEAVPGHGQKGGEADNQPQVEESRKESKPQWRRSESRPFRACLHLTPGGVNPLIPEQPSISTCSHVTQNGLCDHHGGDRGRFGPKYPGAQPGRFETRSLQGCHLIL